LLELFLLVHFQHFWLKTAIFRQNQQYCFKGEWEDQECFFTFLLPPSATPNKILLQKKFAFVTAKAICVSQIFTILFRKTAIFAPNQQYIFTRAWEVEN
jgi:hypothetical protein